MFKWHCIILDLNICAIMQKQLFSTFLLIYIIVSGNKIHAILNNENITKEISIPNIILPSSGLKSFPGDFIIMSIWEIR